MTTKWAVEQNQLHYDYDEVRRDKHNHALEMMRLQSQYEGLTSSLRRHAPSARSSIRLVKMLRWAYAMLIVVLLVVVTWNVLTVKDWWALSMLALVPFMGNALYRLRELPLAAAEKAIDDLEHDDGLVSPKIPEWRLIAATDIDRKQGEEYPGQTEFWEDAERLMTAHSLLGEDVHAILDSQSRQRSVPSAQTLNACDDFISHWDEFSQKWMRTDRPWGVPADAVIADD